jgi:hypothetical protein
VNDRVTMELENRFPTQEQDTASATELQMAQAMVEGAIIAQAVRNALDILEHVKNAAN